MACSKSPMRVMWRPALISPFALNTNPGFRPEHVLTASIDLPPAEYREDASVVSFFNQLMERLQQSPGVIAAGGSTDLPLQGAWQRLFSPEGYQPRRRRRWPTFAIIP